MGGLLLSLFGYWKSQAASEALVQRDALALGIAGVSATVLGAAVYLRYALTKVLRFWLARLSFDLQSRPAPVAPVRPVPRPPEGTGMPPSSPMAQPVSNDHRPPAERLGGYR
jgi:hypothetical protein